MKKIVKTIIIGLGLAEASVFYASASPYFRPLDISHPQVSAGAIWSLNGVKQSVGVTDLALITHSTHDGSIIPASLQKYVAPEDFVPLQVGAGGSFTGQAIINVGASVNVAPQIASLALAGLGKSSSPTAATLEKVLSSPKSGFSFAFGPSWYVLPVNNGTIEPLRKWQGRFGFFTGAAWKF
ncbi:MAG: hypothetical protein KGJ13_10460 [Patescibacteria group bacterium]|nr:hypothetical protein [Patescibacteria group bacterium]